MVKEFNIPIVRIKDLKDYLCAKREIVSTMEKYRIMLSMLLNS